MLPRFLLGALLVSSLLSGAASASGSAPSPEPFDPPAARIVFEPTRLPAPQEKPAYEPPGVDLSPQPALTPLDLRPPVTLPMEGKPEPRLPSPSGVFGTPMGQALSGLSVGSRYEAGRYWYHQGDFQQARELFSRVAGESSPDNPYVPRAHYWLGEIALRQNRLMDAEAAFGNLLRTYPKSEFSDYARFNQGWIAFLQDKPQSAVPPFEEILARSKDLPLVEATRFWLGVALLRIGRPQEAARQWEILRLNGSSPQIRDRVLFWLAEAYWMLGEPGRALAAYNDFINRLPADPLVDRAIARMGVLHLETGQPVEAIKEFRWLLSAFPRTSQIPIAYYGLVRASLAIGDWLHAREAARALTASQPRHPATLHALLRLADHARARGDSRAAIAIYEELLTLLPPTNVRSYARFMVAETERQSGRFSAALWGFRAVKSAGGSPAIEALATYRAGLTFLQTKNYQGAMEEARELLIKGSVPEPIRAAAQFLLGEAGYWAGAYDTAATAYRRFAMGNPDPGKALEAGLSQGWAEYRLGRMETALRVWRDLADRDPRHPVTGLGLFLAAELYAQRADLPRAMESLRELINSQPAHPLVPQAYYNLALSTYLQQDYAGSVQILRALLSRTPASPFLAEVRRLLGGALAAQGGDAEARVEFLRATSLADRPSIWAEAWLGVAVTSFRLGRLEEAAQAFSRAALDERPFVVEEARYGLAAVAYRGGTLEALRQRADDFLTLSPRSAMAPRLLYSLEGLALRLHDLTGAASAVRRLVQAYPESGVADDALYALGRAAGDRSEWSLTKESLGDLLQRYPLSPFRNEARYFYGGALVELKEYAGARDAYRQFVDDQPKDPRVPDALLALGKAEEALGRPLQARAVYQVLVKDYPNYEKADEVLIRSGRLALSARDLPGAEAMFRRAAASDSPSQAAQARVHLGQTLFQEGKSEEAIDILMEAAYLFPDERVWAPLALLHAAQIYRGLKRWEEAAIVYRKLLTLKSLDPEMARRGREGLAAAEAQIVPARTQPKDRGS